MRTPASAPASGTNAGKYLPGETSGFSQTIAGIAGHQIAGNNSPIFDVGLEDRTETLPPIPIW